MIDFDFVGSKIVHSIPLLRFIDLDSRDIYI